MFVYLDYNIMVNFTKAKSVLYFDKYLKIDKFQYLYSPAHLEELAHAHFETSHETIKDYLYTISIITNNNIIRPVSLDKPLSFYSEKPTSTYERVLKNNGGLETTKEVESIDSEAFQLWKNIRQKYNSPFDSKVISNIPPNEIFSNVKHEQVKNIIQLFNCLYDCPLKTNRINFNEKKNSYDFIKDKPYSQLEMLIEAFMKTLQYAGYHSDNKKHFRSATHDISHALYASKCDILVTEDNRFSQRVTAVYSYLGIPTQIMTFNDFFTTILTLSNYL